MANSILSSLFSQASLSITNMNLATTTASNLKISKVSIKLTSTPMRHMREDGTTIVDTRIIKPATLDIDAFCPDVDTISQVNDILMDRTSFYSVASKGIVLDYLMMNHEQMKQSPEVLSAAPVKLSFKQVLVDSEAPIVYAQSSDASVIDRGISILNSSTQTVATLFTKVSSLLS